MAVPLAKTNRQAIKLFWHYPSPWGLAVGSVGWLGIVIYMVLEYDWRWTALIGAGAVILMQPFVEWLLHIFLLHDKPRRIGPWTFDTVVAKDHRAHHLDPRDVRLIFIPNRWLIYINLVIFAIYLFNYIHFDPVTAAVVATTQFIIALTYEWTHFWIHQDVVAFNTYAKLIKRNHRNHHYRNSTYWLGVTSDVADRVFRTAPPYKSIEPVEYAKDLLKTP